MVAGVNPCHPSFNRFLNARRSKMNFRIFSRMPDVRRSDSTTQGRIQIVRCMPRSVWEKLGWNRAGDTYQGFYRTVFGSYKGYIAQKGRNFDVFIFDPPEEAKLHPKWGCFVHRGEKWFWVNQKRAAKDVDGAIVEIQRIIEESFRMAAHRQMKGGKYVISR
jgi:hypothetical protein